MQGDVRAFECLRDTAGMKPVEKKEIQADIRDNGKLDEILKAIHDDDDNDT